MYNFIYTIPVLEPVLFLTLTRINTTIINMNANRILHSLITSTAIDVWLPL